MTVNLKHFNKNIFDRPQTSNNLSKHKITVNQPKQTHFTVEGVQSYAVQQLKALKRKEDRLFENKQGQWVKTKQIPLNYDPNNENDELQQSNNKEKDIKRPTTAKKRGQFKTNARNSVSLNNQALVKLQKQHAKKSLLQRKLQKLQKQYKKHFEGVDLKVKQQQKESAKQISQMQQQNKEQDQEEDGKQQQQLEDNMQKSQHSVSKHQTQKQSENQSIIQSQSNNIKTSKQKCTNGKRTNKQTYHQSNDVNISDGQQMNQSNLGIKMMGHIMTKSTFSQRLGSAINGLFS